MKQEHEVILVGALAAAIFAGAAILVTGGMAKGNSQVTPQIVTVDGLTGTKRIRAPRPQTGPV